MKNSNSIIKRAPLLLFFVALLSSAAVFRVGPKVGFSLGEVAGIHDIGGDTNLEFGVPLGALFQFEREHVGFEVGINYEPRLYGFKAKSGDTGDTETTTIVTQSFEVPVTAYYQLRRTNGYFKFGGGLAAELGVGKVAVHFKDEPAGGSSTSDSSQESYSGVGLKQFDVLLLGQAGYQFNFTRWSLSLDLTPKFGLINRRTSSGPGTGSWHTFVMEFTAGFLF